MRDPRETPQPAPAPQPERRPFEAPRLERHEELERITGGDFDFEQAPPVS